MEKDLRLYISLPISGHDVSVQRKHAETIKAEILKAFPSFQVSTPFEISDILDEEGQVTEGQYLGCDVTYIIDLVDAVFFCNGWDEGSKGCYVEYAVAKAYEKISIFESNIRQHPIAPQHGKTLEQVIRRALSPNPLSK